MSPELDPTSRSRAARLTAPLLGAALLLSSASALQAQERTDTTVYRGDPIIVTATAAWGN